MKRHSSWAAVVLAAVAVPFLLPAALRGESPLDKDYVKARSAVDDLAALGLFWIARDYASHGFKERADEVGKAALEIASDAKKKEIKAALSKPPAKRDAPEDSKLFEARLERDVDHCVVRGVRRYQKLAAKLKPEQKPERTDLDRRIARLKSVSLHRDEIERDTRESPDASKPRQEDDDDGSAAGGAGGGGGRGLGGVWRAGPAAQPQLKQKPPTQDDGPPDQAVLKRVNYYRLKAGIAAVELDPDLSAGCQAHCEYLAQNAGKPQVAGLKAHEEDPSLPGATDEGARAGRHSDLAWGFSATEAVDAWVDSLYHRTPVFHPDLKKIGVGWKDDKKSGPICALDLSEHLQTKESTKTSVVAFPPVGLSDVPTSFWDFEMPDPLPSGAANPAGYVLTLAGYRDRLADCAGTLEKDGASIDCWFSSPDQPSPAGAGYHGNVICLIPKGPLAKGATYKLTWQYQSQGVKGRQVITFTTSSSDE